MSVTAVGSRPLRLGGARKTRSRRGEAIRMEAKRFGYFPQTFVWRGKRYDVHAVERCWTRLAPMGVGCGTALLPRAVRRRDVRAISGCQTQHVARGSL